ncbi:unnamed protein product, partial [Symbiodinium necroappetens]
DCRQEACPLEVEDASLMQDAPARSSAEEADRIDGPWRKQWRWKQGWWHGRRGYYSYYSGGSTTGTTTEPAPGPPPPPLFCEDAEPQSPRDLTPGFVGGLEPRIRPLDGDATPRFIQANLHFHLGAEHRSNITNGYFQSAEDVGLSTPLVRPQSSPDIREGYFCGLDDVSSDDRDYYPFTHCKGVSVNYTYEFHWVYSTGAPLIGLRDEGDEGQLGITDGLGGALARTNNPKIIVRGQVCRIIYNKSLGSLDSALVDADYDNFLQKWRQPPETRGVRYIGSTTGTSFNNSVCSPLEVSRNLSAVVTYPLAVSPVPEISPSLAVDPSPAGLAATGREQDGEGERENDRCCQLGYSHDSVSGDPTAGVAGTCEREDCTHCQVEDSALMQFKNHASLRPSSSLPQFSPSLLSNASEPSNETAPVLLCEDAEPQSPRDLTPTFKGGLQARVRPLDGDATPRFIQANLHFHLGAEHKSEIPNGYFHEADDVGLATPLVRPDPSIREGYFCGLDDVSSDDRDFYNFTFCKDVSVNYTYEFHWVFSTGAPLIGLRDEGAEGQLGITDGLGGALNRTNNPKIIVRGQVCRIIYNKSLVDVEADYDNFVNQWRQPPLGRAVRYIGSTTGTDFNNSVCSPLEVNWHVDTECCTLSAQTFDRLCEAMEGQGLSKDLAPKPSRILVSEEISATVAFPLSPSPEPESVEL